MRKKHREEETCPQDVSPKRNDSCRLSQHRPSDIRPELFAADPAIGHGFDLRAPLHWHAPCRPVGHPLLGDAEELRHARGPAHDINGFPHRVFTHVPITPRLYAQSQAYVYFCLVRACSLLT